MCFLINKNATKPKNKIAWKLMNLSASSRGGYLRSPVFRITANWAPGDVMVARYNSSLESTLKYEEPWSELRPRTFSWKRQMELHAAAGIYVYLDKQDAITQASWRQVVVALEVDPKDWLYTSLCGTQATYREARIAPISRQPYIEYA